MSSLPPSNNPQPDILASNIFLAFEALKPEVTSALHTHQGDAEHLDRQRRNCNTTIRHLNHAYFVCLLQVQVFVLHA